MSRSQDRTPPEAEAGPETTADGLTRRSFLIGAGGVAAGGAIAATPGSAGETTAPARRSRRGRSHSEPFEVTFTLNGEPVTVEVEPRTTLLDLLRHRVQPPLTGTKEGCDRGTCGACTVLLDGAPVYACSLLAASIPGRAVTTIEGFGSPDDLSPVQQAFCEHDALMCGFCTPGMVVSVTACLEANPDAGDEAIKTACSGHICRCGTYPQILDAARDAGAKLKEERR